mmetsp:Transcript_31117/g.65145  ORF Transcript_31117/g.65145 Transcript_31117/m.65145 type:complete len:202 (+) Transcript_31117:129-734(+)
MIESFVFCSSKRLAQQGKRELIILPQVNRETHLLQLILQRSPLLPRLSLKHLSQRTSLRPRQLINIQSLIPDLLLQRRQRPLKQPLLVPAMSHGHALIVTQQPKHALILNNHSIVLFRLRKQPQLVLHRLHHRLQHGRLVRGTNRPRKVKLLQRLPSRVLGRHHHKTEVLEHLHGITIGVTRKVHRLIPPHAEEKVHLFLR